MSTSILLPPALLTQRAAPAPDSGGREHLRPPMVAMVMTHDNHGPQVLRQLRAGSRPVDIPELNGTCALAECIARVVPGSRFAGIITRRTPNGPGGEEPSRWVVVACSMEHLQTVIERVGR